jgi:hypothetical protein
MAAKTSMSPDRFLHEQLAGASRGLSSGQYRLDELSS